MAMVPAQALPAPGACVLDVGCGPAGIFMILEQQQVLAMDPLQADYVASGLLAPAAFPWVTFHTGNLEAVPDAIDRAGPYPTIFCMNVLNHVGDVARCLESLHRMCTTDASVILSIDVHRTRFFKRLLRILPLDRLHPHQLMLSDYERMLVGNGFSVVGKAPIWKRGVMAHWLLVVTPAQK
jgi:2-polyprenyl-6-hydroxyphenyl methylase/3-demethylubiquinone-9 3-methyltransferase